MAIESSFAGETRQTTRKWFQSLFHPGFAELVHDNFNGSRKEGPRHWLQLLGTEPVEASGANDSYQKAKLTKRFLADR